MPWKQIDADAWRAASSQRRSIVPEAQKDRERLAARHRAAVARTMWADAVRDGICDLNPWTNLRLETPKGRKDIDALTEQEIAELADLAARAIRGLWRRRRGRSS